MALSEQEEFELLSLERERARAPEAAAPTPQGRPLTGRVGKFISGNINRGIAMTLDAPAKAMTDVYNLGKAAVGTVATAAGRPDLAPELTPDPEGYRKIGEATGLITKEAEPETTGQKAGAMALQLTGGMAVPIPAGKRAGAFTQMRDAAAIAAAERGAQRASFDQALEQSRRVGYVFPPSQVSSGVVSGGIEGLVARTAPTERVASVRNAVVTNRLVRRDLGLTTTQPITDATFEEIRRGAGQAHEAVKKSGVQIKADKEFTTALEKLKTSDYGQAAKEYEGVLANQAVDDLVKGMSKPEVSPTAAVEMVKELRRRATKNIKAWDNLEKQDLGYAQRTAAQALEDLVQRNLAAAGKEKLVSAWKEARTTIAKAHDAEAAWDGSNFSAKELAKSYDKGAPLTGGMQQAAEFARHFPKAAQDVTKMAQRSGFSQYDAWAGGAGAWAFHQPAVLALATVPYLTQRALLSGLGQKMLGKPNYKVGLGLRSMAALDPIFARSVLQGALQEGQPDEP